jgi:TldD protein
LIPVIYKRVSRQLDLGGPAQAGWEFVSRAPVRELIRQTMDEIDRTVPLPAKGLNVGRYDLICPAPIVAVLLDGTFGAATQVDRALGYEANAGGTTYLGPDPLRCLGTPVASPLLTLTAERTSPRALATIKWDDEGVEAAPFTLIQDGILTDYQTTREGAAWLAPWYQRHGTPVRSRGCLASGGALNLPMQHTPNLVMQPGPHPVDLDALIQGMDHGYVVESMDLDMDFQQLNGLGLVTLTEVRGGRRVGRVWKPAGLLFHTPELWQQLAAVGGAGSAAWSVGTSEKGEPAEQVSYSLQTVPALFTQQAIVDPRKKG